MYANLLANTKRHELQVLHDDGLYRHLRFKEPGTTIWYFDISTWPGSLTIRGDIGKGYTFTRADDMIAWFTHNRAPGTINAQYWAEKLEASCQTARRYEHDAFHSSGRVDIEAWDLSHDDQERALSEWQEAVDACDPWPTAALECAGEFRFVDSAGTAHQFADVGEWELDDWDFHFLLACHAIHHASLKYLEMRDAS